jgi:hypothetical protein
MVNQYGTMALEGAGDPVRGQVAWPAQPERPQMLYGQRARAQILPSLDSHQALPCLFIVEPQFPHPQNGNKKAAAESSRAGPLWTLVDL